MTITYPPELLPSPDEGDDVEVICLNSDGTQRILFCSTSFAPAHECRCPLLRRDSPRQFVDR